MCFTHVLRESIVFLTIQEGYSYSYIPPLLNDSIQLLTQAVYESLAFSCDDSGSPDSLCNVSASFGDILSTMLLKSNFQGKSVRMLSVSAKNFS